MTPDEAPSWVRAAAPPAPAPAVPHEPVPRQLVVAAGLTVVLALLEAVHIANRDDLVVGFRVFLALIALGQVPLAYYATRLVPAAALGLFVYQVTAVMAAVAGGFGDVRGPLALGALVVGVLLGRSLDAFPSPELPRLDT